MACCRQTQTLFPWLQRPERAGQARKSWEKDHINAPGTEIGSDSMNASREIENLLYRYAELIDRGDLEGVAQLFCRGEIVSTAYNTRHAGYHEVLELYQKSCRIYPDCGTPKTRHLTTNVIIDIAEDGNEGSARACFTVLQAAANLPLQPIIAGRYEDCFRLGPEGWEFARREMFIDLMGDCSAHLLYPVSQVQDQ